MKALPTAIAGVLILEPRIFEDERGFFFESWNAREFARAVGQDVRFVQDNHSRSKQNVLRGIHYQVKQPQGKLVRVGRGCVFDVAVDLRRSSQAFGRWVGLELSEDNRRQLWIPVGVAHAFLALSENADLLYKATDYYAPEHERCLAWNDSAVGIKWPLLGEPIMSAKDRAGLPLEEVEVFA
jgi:dTDP-4-dehydrorhamnose 3,5-epimerase